MSKWKWIYHGNDTLRDVGILADGTLHNPNAYPEDVVRAAVQAADEERRARRSEAAKKAAVTRARRQEAKIAQFAKSLLAGAGIKSQTHCAICGKGLDDRASIARGVGSDCWQDVQSYVEELKRLEKMGAPS